MTDEVVEAIENHRFAPVAAAAVAQRRPGLRHAPTRLIAQPRGASRPRMADQRAREADDLLALKALVEMPEMRDRLRAAATCACCGTSAGFPTSARSRAANMRASCAGSSASCGTAGSGARPTGWPRQIAPHRPNRWRHRRIVETAGLYPHLDLCRAAQGLGRRRKPLARRDPRGRRPPVGCAARAADPAICRPAHLAC